MARVVVPLWCVPHEEGFLLLEEGREVRLVPHLPEDAHCVVLANMRTLSVQPFSYPFDAVTRIREALAVQARSLLVGGGNVEILPTVTKREGRAVSGVAWFWTSTDRFLPADGKETKGRVQIWPAPLALAAESGDEGLVLHNDGNGISSMLFEAGIPKCARWRPASEKALESEKTWYEKGFGRSIPSVVVDSSGKPGERMRFLAEAATKTWKTFPAYRDVDLSPGGVDSLMVWDRAFRAARMPLAALLGGGLLFLGAGWLHLQHVAGLDARLREESAAVYKEVFSATSVTDPLSQARARLAALTGEDASKQIGLGRVLRLVGSLWESVSADVEIETLRYAESGVQISGSAPEIGALTPLKERIKAAEVPGEVEDISTIPGGRVRFGLSFRWDKQ